MFTDVNTCKLQDTLSVSYRFDLAESILRAQAGKLSPHWQKYCFDIINAQKNTPNYPNNGDALLNCLTQTLKIVPQITDYEDSCAELAACGGQLLFHYSQSPDTLIEIVYRPDHSYDAYAYIDACIGKESIQKISDYLDSWCAAAQLSVEKPTNKNAISLADVDGCFTSLTDAVVHLYTCLAQLS